MTALLRTLPGRAARAAAPARDRARGGATAETAVALPALVLVLAVCLSAVSMAGTALRCADAARAAARALARGEPPDAVSAAATAAAGRDLDLVTSRSGDLVTVRVTARAAPLPLAGRLLPDVVITRDATARAEPAGGWP